MILAGDIGGTKATLALFDAGEVIREATFASGDFASLDAILSRFLVAGDAVERACLGVAGPVEAGVARITNLPWVVDARALAAAIGTSEVVLVNDLQATAHGMLFLAPSAFVALHAGAVATAPATTAVIAPGTGLGEALLYYDGRRYHAVPSEGGHADLAPETDDEIELLRALRHRFGHVSWERVLSGDGLANIYAFLRARAEAEPVWLTTRRAGRDPNAVIAETGLAGEDRVCADALAMFSALLGAEAGNLALRGAAVGGVIIGGGIAPKILPVLRGEGVVARFLGKGRFAPWLARVPLKVAVDPRAALIGAAHWASEPAIPRTVQASLR